MAYVRFQADVLRQVGARIFSAIGAPDETARIVAGRPRHGQSDGARFARHASPPAVRPGGAAGRGRCRPRGRGVVSVRGATALVSGDWAFGQLTGRAAMDEAVRLAGEHGVGMVAAVRARTSAASGNMWNGRPPADAWGWSGSAASTRSRSPTAGSRRALGTNPMAVGFPVGRGRSRRARLRHHGGGGGQDRRGPGREARGGAGTAG